MDVMSKNDLSLFFLLMGVKNGQWVKLIILLGNIMNLFLPMLILFLYNQAQWVLIKYFRLPLEQIQISKSIVGQLSCQMVIRKINGELKSTNPKSFIPALQFQMRVITISVLLNLLHLATLLLCGPGIIVLQIVDALLAKGIVIPIMIVMLAIIAPKMQEQIMVRFLQWMFVRQRKKQRYHLLRLFLLMEEKNGQWAKLTM